MASPDTKTKTQAKLKNRLGIDIGSHSIKTVEVSSDKLSLISLGLKKIPVSSGNSVLDALKALIDEAHIEAREAAISVSGPSVIVRFITMPKMKEEELKGAVRFEAEKFIPFDVNDCVVNFHVLNKEARDNKIEIALAAAKKGYVTDRVNLLKDAGFSVRVVDVDGFAVTNSFFKNFPGKAGEDKIFALLNIGRTLTNLNILKGANLSFSRDIAVGGKDVDSAIAACLGIEPEKAEELKVGHKEKARGVIDCTKNVLANLLDEVKLSFSYHENQSGRSVDEIYLSGGGSSLDGLDEGFEEIIGLKPSRWDPLKFLDAASANADKALPDGARSSFAVAAGLALR